MHMKIQGQVIDHLPLIENHIVDYYQNILGVTGTKGGSIHYDFWAEHERVTFLENSLLIAPFSKEEIKHAIFSSDKLGTPSPYGVSFGFYQYFWDTVKYDICQLVQAFVDNKISLVRLNQAVVLISRGFDLKWVSWILQLLYSSTTCININGRLSSYFPCRCGVQQGDPFSPFLFLLVGDVLCRLFNKGREAGILQGLGPCLANGQSVTIAITPTTQFYF